MAYDEDLVERLRLVLADERLSEKSMFGGLAFLVDGHMAVAAHVRHADSPETDPAKNLRETTQLPVAPLLVNATTSAIPRRHGARPVLVGLGQERGSRAGRRLIQVAISVILVAGSHHMPGQATVGGRR